MGGKKRKGGHGRKDDGEDVEEDIPLPVTIHPVITSVLAGSPPSQSVSQATPTITFSNEIETVETEPDILESEISSSQQQSSSSEITSSTVSVASSVSTVPLSSSNDIVLIAAISSKSKNNPWPETSSNEYSSNDEATNANRNLAIIVAVVLLFIGIAGIVLYIRWRAKRGGSKIEDSHFKVSHNRSTSVSDVKASHAENAGVSVWGLQTYESNCAPLEISVQGASAPVTASLESEDLSCSTPGMDKSEERDIATAESHNPEKNRGFSVVIDSYYHDRSNPELSMTPSHKNSYVPESPISQELNSIENMIYKLPPPPRKPSISRQK
jgi:hypothetical protein